MNTPFFLRQFQNAAIGFHKNAKGKDPLQTEVGIYQNSVFIKLFQPSWSNDPQNAAASASRIFFSVWVTDEGLEAGRLFYNIHAFKLRHLNGYAIASRQFAEVFRADFKKVMQQWENVSIQFGPLTLMEGWVAADEKNIPEKILQLCLHFQKIENLVEKTLLQFKK